MGFLIDTCIWAAVERGALAPADVAQFTGEIFGSLAAQMKALGLQHRHRVQDLWLASQAIQNGLSILTCNEKNLIDIPGLSLRVL